MEPIPPLGMEKRTLFSIVGIVVLIAVAAGWYFLKYRQAADNLPSPANGYAPIQPLDKVPDISPTAKTNPFTKIKTNPFD